MGIMKKKILVTGGNGFIGSHLVERLTLLKHKVNVVDVVGKGYNLDICSPDLSGLINKLKPEVVYHLAADNRVTGSVREILASNVIGTYSVLEACRQAKIKQFIFTSSAAVYGDPKFLPITETHTTRPLSPYGLSKLTDELYCQQFQKFFKTSIFRFANVYGPRQSSQSEGGVVAIFTNRLLKGQKPIIYGDGSQTRDFVYVDDVVDALILALEKPQNFILNIGSNQPVKITDLLKKISGIIRAKPQHLVRSFRQMEIKHSLFDYHLAKQVLGWQPKTELKRGLNETVNYFTSIQRS
jgi:UDP-glucose 4-epimerase